MPSTTTTQGAGATRWRRAWFELTLRDAARDTTLGAVSTATDAEELVTSGESKYIKRAPYENRKPPKQEVMSVVEQGRRRARRAPAEGGSRAHGWCDGSLLGLGRPTACGVCPGDAYLTHHVPRCFPPEMPRCEGSIRGWAGQSQLDDAASVNLF